MESYGIRLLVLFCRERVCYLGVASIEFTNPASVLCHLPKSVNLLTLRQKRNEKV